MRAPHLTVGVSLHSSKSGVSRCISQLLTESHSCTVVSVLSYFNLIKSVSLIITLLSGCYGFSSTVLLLDTLEDDTELKMTSPPFTPFSEESRNPFANMCRYLLRSGTVQKLLRAARSVPSV